MNIKRFNSKKRPIIFVMGLFLCSLPVMAQESVTIDDGEEKAEDLNKRSLQKSQTTKKEPKQKTKPSKKSSGPRLHGIGLGLGQTFLLGNYERYGDNKITLDLLYAYQASRSFDFFVNAHSSNHSYKEKEIRVQGLGLGIKARAFDFDSFAPYVVGGFGFYQPRIVNGDNESDPKSTFGVNAGLGAELRLNPRFSFGLLGLYHAPFDVKQDDIEDIKGSYMKLLLTTMYHF